MLERIIPDAIDKAKALDYTDFNEELLELRGFSGKMTRVFLNRLLSNPGLSYLEVGVWGGSTFCSALNNNHPQYAVAVDNFSQTWEEDFGFDPSKVFFENTRKFIPTPFDFINSDCFSLDLGLIKRKINCYLYDGDHYEEDQYKALSYYYPIMEDEFIYIVDDYNWLDVKIGTLRAIRDLNLTIVRDWNLPTKYNGDYNSWWNGYGIFVLRKG